jgi:hypothetical protein
MEYDALLDIKEKCREMVNILIVLVSIIIINRLISAEILPSVTI